MLTVMQHQMTRRGQRSMKKRRVPNMIIGVTNYFS